MFPDVNGFGKVRDMVGVEAVVSMSGDVSEAQACDPERLFIAHRRELVAFARVVGGSETAAEEAVQDVFVSMFRRLPVIAPGRELAYLRRAVLLQLRGRWRRLSTARKHLRSVSTEEVDSCTPEDSALERYRRTQIDMALSQLSPRQRECVALRYFADLTEPAVSEELGISVGSVKTHLHRAREVLASSLEDLR